MLVKLAMSLHTLVPQVANGTPQTQTYELQDVIDLILLTKEDEIHAALTERFATKGKRCLRTGQSPLDYLSMVCTTADNKRIQISMDDYRKR